MSEMSGGGEVTREVDACSRVAIALTTQAEHIPAASLWRCQLTRTCFWFLQGTKRGSVKGRGNGFGFSGQQHQYSHSHLCEYFLICCNRIANNLYSNNSKGGDEEGKEEKQRRANFLTDV